MIRQVVFTLEQKQAIEAIKKHQRKAFISRKTIIQLISLWIVAVACLSAILYFIEGKDWLHFWGKALLKSAFVYFIIIVLIAGLNYYILRSYAARKSVRNDRQIGLEQTWIWDDHAIAIRSSYIKRTFPLRLFYDWQEYPDFFALYISKDKFSILPKNIMSEEQIIDLREVLSREIINK